MTQVTYHGGPLIPRVEIVSIYLNVVIESIPAGDWHRPDLQQMALSLDRFLDTITDSAYLDALAEYSEGIPYTLGRGKRLQSYFLTAGPFAKNDAYANVIETSADPSVLSETTAHNWAHLVPWLKDNILGGTLPPPTPNRCYLVFLPPGVSLAFGVGRHDSFYLQLADGDMAEVYFAVIAYSSSQDVQDVLDDLTLAVSHELVEAITDPSHAHNGWHADEEAEREIADLCESAWYNYAFNGYQVVSFWSWTREQCVHCPLTIRLENGVSPNSVRVGQVAHFSLDIPCIPQDARAKLIYHWTVSPGATPVESDTQQDCLVLMPSAPAEVTVTVFVAETVEGNVTQMSSTAMFAVVP